jgi:hypothetical protein
MLTRTLIGVVLAALLVYGAIEALPLVSGPGLTIISPTDGEMASSTGVVEVSGTAARAAGLTLDGAPLLVDAAGGHFATTLAFPVGTSILTFVAHDRFGRTITKTRTVVVP